MTDKFYDPRPAVSFLTLRTNDGFRAGHVPRTLPQPSVLNQPNSLPLGLGFAPEIPAGVMEQMVGDRLTGEAEATNPVNQGTSALQTTMWK